VTLDSGDHSPEPIKEAAMLFRNASILVSRSCLAYKVSNKFFKEIETTTATIDTISGWKW
jgi:hypothetical protein